MLKRRLLFSVVFFSLFLISQSFLPAVSHADPLDNWHLRDLPQNNWLISVTYGNGTFVAVGFNWIEGYGMVSVILTSSDGITWTNRMSEPYCYLNGVTYGNGTFVATGSAGGNGIIFTSQDGITWTNRMSDPNYSLQGVTYGNGIFMVIGTNNDAEYHGAVLTSPDGIVWTVKASNLDYYLYGITYGNGIFVVASEDNQTGNGLILTSTNGNVWTVEEISNQNYVPFTITYGNGMFVTAGYDSSTGGYTISTSLDATTWTTIDAGLYSFYGIAYGNGTFVAVGDNYIAGNSGAIVTSSDGINWIARNSGTNVALYAVAFGNNTFVAVGLNSTILQSDPIAVPPNMVPVGVNVNVTPAPNINITFSNVISSGTITATEIPAPVPPANFTILGKAYDITTTAVFTGLITVCLGYDDTGLTINDENNLTLLHYKFSAWNDITSSRDAVNNKVCGITDSLSPFVIAKRTSTPTYNFSGFLPPINSNKNFKIGSTIPVKFQLTDANGNYISTASATIMLQKYSDNEPVGEPIYVSSISGADSGNTFRYSSTDNQYIYNLNTKNLSAGTWQIRVSLLDDGTVKTVFITLKK